MWTCGACWRVFHAALHLRLPECFPLNTGIVLYCEHSVCTLPGALFSWCTCTFHSQLFFFSSPVKNALPCACLTFPPASQPFTHMRQQFPHCCRALVLLCAATTTPMRPWCVGGMHRQRSRVFLIAMMSCPTWYLACLCDPPLWAVVTITISTTRGPQYTLSLSHLLQAVPPKRCQHAGIECCCMTIMHYGIGCWHMTVILDGMLSRTL